MIITVMKRTGNGILSQLGGIDWHYLGQMGRRGRFN